MVWNNLSDHRRDIASYHMRDWFAKDSSRFSRFSLQADGLFLDYSRNRITDQTIQLLCELASQSSLTARIEALFSGQRVNTTEQRAAWHTLLRDPAQHAVSEMVAAERARLYDFVNHIRSSSFKHIVNVGIGGSYLGPLLTTNALSAYNNSGLNFHFISCVDPSQFDEVLGKIDPATTLFIISSKSFTTFETQLNAKSLLNWMSERVGKAAVSHHFVAVTASEEKALAMGIAKERIFPVWDWVGGRYSIWSAIGLPLMLMIGTEQFEAFLAGAHSMDQHFRRSSFPKNMPVLMALLGIWYTNFFDADAHVIAPYSQRLRYLVPYLQQADMESNGKRVTQQQELVACQTAPVTFGEAGCNAQHTYHQLLHQGTRLIPVDFITIKGSDDSNAHEDALFASALSQAQALMHGQTHVIPYQDLPGNRPSNIILLDTLSPYTLGALIALYEHKIFVQGVIWNINSFDQWGVELGKKLLPDLLDQLQQGHSKDPAVSGLIKQYKGT